MKAGRDTSFLVKNFNVCVFLFNSLVVGGIRLVACGVCINRNVKSDFL